MPGQVPDDYPRPGTFTISPGREVFGQLTINGADSLLYLRDDEFLHVGNIEERCIKGVLHDLTRVSLLDCITQSSAGSGGRRQERYSFAEIFPHYVVLGDQHLGPTENVIKSVEFVVDDATTLFYDFDAFGHLTKPAEFIEQLVRAQEKAVNRSIPIGPFPDIQYFTGKRQIVRADTVFGDVSASHNPHFHFPGPGGLRLDNTITIIITPEEPITFDKAIERLLIVQQYLGLLAGRPQNVTTLLLHLGDNENPSVPLRVHWSLKPVRDVRHGMPHVADILLDAVRDGESFARVLCNWLKTHHDRQDSRGRFFACFAKGWSFDIDRLIGAANMFDLLPSSAVPRDVALSPELEAAKQASRIMFSDLPDSAERQSILSELGRLGKSKLKHKIRHRAKVLTSRQPGKFPDLAMVADEAVNCRNHYVHGSEPSFDYRSAFDIVNFFTGTLEFVFATSDLIDAGWDINNWATGGSTLSHPFAAYRYSYRESLARLKSLLSQEP